MTKNKTWRMCVTAVCSGAMMLSTAGFAGAQEPGAAERVNFSGKLRMLSQRTAAASCNLSANISVDESRDVLSASQAEFSKILAALRNGDADLNIPSTERNADILAAIDTLEATWAPINAAISALVLDNNAEADAALIAAQNMALLEDAKALVKLLVGEYTDSAAANNNLGNMIDIAGRQRMLTQKMAKEACQIWSGDSSPEVMASLKGTIDLFESSQIALQEGDEDARVARPPSDAIKASLDTVWTQWSKVKTGYEAALGGKVPSDAGRGKAWEQASLALRNTNAVVGQYTRYKDEQQLIEDTGATERVNFSGKLRMLSQRVAALACNYDAGVDADANLAALVAAQAEFEKITLALEHGDADLRIKGAETRRRPLEALAGLHETWDPINAAIGGLVRGENAAENLITIETGNMALLEKAKLLASEVNGAYSDPTAMLQADAILVDISGRQRMLTQKMSKEACLVWSGVSPEENSAALAKTMQLFEVSLNALREGYIDAGVKPAPTDGIRAGLDDILSDWMELKPALQGAADQSAADAAARSDALARLNTALKEMNEVVGLYTVYAKAGL